MTPSVFPVLRRGMPARIVSLTFALAVAAVLLAGPSHPARAQAGPNASPPMADGRHLIVTVALTNRREAEAQTARFAASHAVDPVTVWPLRSIGLHCLIVRVRPGASVRGTIAALAREPGVRTVEIVKNYRTSAESYRDELFPRQAALRAMNVPRAHALATGSRVRVALIDTGVNAAHLDLRRRIVAERDVVDDGRPGEDEAHGTAVAGVLAADGRNYRGMVGVAPDARIVAVRACWEVRGVGRCTSFSLARALNLAILERVDVINMSLAGPDDPLLQELVRTALRRGIVVVAARGRGRFPAGVPGVIAVGGAGSQARPGRVPAPARDIITTIPGGGYAFRSGTSLAAGHVSGVVALMRQRAPSAPPGRIAAALAGSVRRPEDGGGRVVDACRAVGALSGGAGLCDAGH